MEDKVDLEAASGGVSYIPMRVFTVTLRVEVPVGEPGPDEWDWAALTDMNDEDIEVETVQIVSTYNRDLPTRGER